MTTRRQQLRQSLLLSDILLLAQTSWLSAKQLHFVLRSYSEAGRTGILPLTTRPPFRPAKAGVASTHCGHMAGSRSGGPSSS